MRLALCTFTILVSCANTHAGLHYSAEQFAEFPVKWRGYLLDHRNLRYAAVETPDGQPASPLREEYLAARTTLETLAKQRSLTADELADLGALHVRLGEPLKAVNVLRPAARQHSQHFRLAANLGTAWQAAGDLEQAANALEDAVRLAPEAMRDTERAHLKLVRSRHADPRPTGPDDLFGVRYVGESGKAEAGKLATAEAKKLPVNALAVTQRLALALPQDGRLLWQLAELANARGDVRSAAAMLDGCAGEFRMGQAELLRRRTLYRKAADELTRNPQKDTHAGHASAKSDHALIRRFDERRLPPVRTDAPNPLPWPALAVTTFNRLARPTFLKHLDALDGHTVTLNGFMQPVRDELELTGFLLVEYPIGCWFCESPEPTGMVFVEMTPGRKAELKKGLVHVRGTLTLNRDNPEAFLYTIKDAHVGGAN